MKDKKKYNLSYFMKFGGRKKYNSPPLPGEKNGNEANLSNLNTVIEGELNQNNLSNNRHNGNNGNNGNGNNGNGHNGNIRNNRLNANSNVILAESNPNQIDDIAPEILAPQIEQAEIEQAEREQAEREQAEREQAEREQAEREQAEREQALREQEQRVKKNMKKQSNQQKGEFISHASAIMNKFNSASGKSRTSKKMVLVKLEPNTGISAKKQGMFTRMHNKSKNIRHKDALAEASSANTGTRHANVVEVGSRYQTPNQKERSKASSASASSANARSNSMDMFLKTVSILREDPEVSKRLYSAFHTLGSRYAKGSNLNKYVDRIRRILGEVTSRKHRAAMSELTDEELIEFILQSFIRTHEPEINAIRASSLERLRLAEKALKNSQDMAKLSSNQSVINQLHEAQQQVQIANQVHNLSQQINSSQVQLQESQESLRLLEQQQQTSSLGTPEEWKKRAAERYQAEKAVRNAQALLKNQESQLKETADLVLPQKDYIKILRLVKNPKAENAKEVFVTTRGRVLKDGPSPSSSSSSSFSSNALKKANKKEVPLRPLPNIKLTKKQPINLTEKQSKQMIESQNTQLKERREKQHANFLSQRKKLLKEGLKQKYGNDKGTRNKLKALFPGATKSKEKSVNAFGDVIEASEASEDPAAKFLKSVEDETNGEYAELKTHGDRLIYYNKLKKLYPDLSNEKSREKNMKRKKAYERETGKTVSLLDDAYADINEDILALTGMEKSNAANRKARFESQLQKEKTDRQRDNGKQDAEAAKAEEVKKLQKMHDNEVSNYQRKYTGLSDAEKPAFLKEMADLRFLFEKLKNKYPGLTPKQKRDYYKELQQSYPLLSNKERENINAHLKTEYPSLSSVSSRKSQKSRNNKYKEVEEEEEQEEQAMRRAPPRMSVQNSPVQNSPVQNAPVQNAPVQNAPVQNALVNNGFTLVQRKQRNQRNQRNQTSIPTLFEKFIKKILKIEMLDKTTEEKTKYRIPFIREYIHDSDYSIEQLDDLIGIVSDLEIPINVKKRYLRELDKKIKENLKDKPKPNKSGQTFSELLLRTSNTSRTVNKSKSYANALKPNQNKAKPLPKSSTKTNQLSDLSEFTRVLTFNEKKILKQEKKILKQIGELPNPKIKIKDIRLQIKNINNKTIQQNLKKILDNKLRLITRK